MERLQQAEVSIPSHTFDFACTRSLILVHHSGLLHLLQVMDVWNCLVVVSRWFGGVKLGPDRFRLINQAAREALVEWREHDGKPS